MPDGLDPDVLAELRARLEATQRAAERLAAEAAAARVERTGAEEADPAGPRRPPASGWHTPEADARRNEELAALLALVQAVRELVPDELVDQVRELVRELLVLLRGLIDWSLSRLEEPAGARPADEVHEVPVTGPREV